MSWMVLTAVAVAANVLGAAMAAPQAVHLYRTRQVAGVSVAWAAISFTLNAWWCAYAIALGVWAVLPVAVVSTVLYASVVAVLFRLGDRRRAAAKLIGAAAAASVLPALAAVVIGWGSVGIVLGALYGAQLTPAVIAVHRGADLSGVSALTWRLAWGEAVLFGVYGLAHHDAGLITLAGFGLVASMLILVRLAVVDARPVVSVVAPLPVTVPVVDMRHARAREIESASGSIGYGSTGGPIRRLGSQHIGIGEAQ